MVTTPYWDSHYGQEQWWSPLIIIVLIPKDKSIYPSVKVSFNVIERTFNDAEYRFNDAERTFNVAERNFLLGKSTIFPNNNQDFSS